MTPNQKRVINEFLEWFETLNQKDQLDLMVVIGRVFRRMKK